MTFFIVVIGTLRDALHGKTNLLPPGDSLYSIRNLVSLLPLSRCSGLIDMPEGEATAGRSVPQLANVGLGAPRADRARRGEGKRG
jgi:hypothetical protein